MPTANTPWERVTKYDPALSKALKPWLSRDEDFHLLMRLTAANHPIVNMPKEKTLVALIRANPLREFQRRLTMLNN